jgi:hypothetical protein
MAENLPGEKNSKSKTTETCRVRHRKYAIAPEIPFGLIK